MKLVVPVLAFGLALSASASADPTRSQSLVLDGQPAAPLTNASTAQTSAGAEATVVASVAAAGAPVWAWIAPAVEGHGTPRTATVVTADPSGRSSTATQLAGATVRRVVLPALDAADRAPQELTLSFGAPSASTVPSGKAEPNVRPAAPAPVSAFRVDVDGMPTRRASSVGAITITVPPPPPAPVAERGIGLEARPRIVPLAPGAIPVRAAAAVTVSPVVLRVPLAEAAPWQQWLASGAATKRSGSVQYLDATLRHGPTLTLHGLSITRVTTDGSTGKATVEMNVDSVALAP